MESLATHPELSERIEACVSRFGRLQNTMADKLLPRWLFALAERPGSQIEVLNRSERLGIVEDATTWLEARQLRNRLAHEYMTDKEFFARDLKLAEAYSQILFETYRRLSVDAIAHLKIPAEKLPTE